MTALHRSRRGPPYDDRHAALAYLADAELIVRTVRGALVGGDPDFGNVPKLCLEMVRCTVLVDRVVGRADPALAELRDALLGELRELERCSPSDPRGDQRLAGAAGWWAAYRTAAVRVLADGQHPRPDETRASSLPHTHPVGVLPYLRPELPCPGLVAAAARAFAAEPRPTAG